MQKKTKVIISVLVAVMVVIGGFYLYASRTVAKRLPGHVYEYTSVSGNQNAYMTFATSGDQVVWRNLPGASSAHPESQPK